MKDKKIIGNSSNYIADEFDAVVFTRARECLYRASIPAVRVAMQAQLGFLATLIDLHNVIRRQLKDENKTR